MKPLDEWRLYGILDLAYTPEDRVVSTVTAMAAGGVDVIQVRAKDHPVSRIRDLSHRVISLCSPQGIPVIINDHPELVGQVGAQGVHVGQDDLSVARARELAGQGAIVGKSTHSPDQARAAVAEGADYIGFGPLFSTPTKPDYQAIGLGDIAEVHRSVQLPIFCIGGIKRENLKTVMTAGARRAVVVSGILLAGDIAEYCRECRALLAE